MALNEPNYENFDEAPLPEESNNRTFLIAVGILGGIILISLACLVGVYLFGVQSRTAAQRQAAANATLTAQAAENFISQALTATFQASILPTVTLQPTNTAVVSVATPTATPTETVAQQADAAATATVGAALTQAAIAQLTVVFTPTQLARTGLLDDYGIPGLAVMTLAFVIVILLARRLRTAPIQ